MQNNLSSTDECVIIAPARFDYRLLQIVLVAFLIGYLLVPAAFAIVSQDDKYAVWGGAAGPFVAIAVLLMAERISAGSWRGVFDELGMKHFPWLIFWLALPLSLGVLVGSVIITTLWSLLAEYLEWSFDLPVTTEIFMNGNYAEVTVLVVTALLAAPFFEEVLFRKAIFEAINVKFGRPIAYLTASLAFAAVHFSLQQMPGLTCMALLWQFMSRWQHSLWASIILHFWNNLLATGMALLAKYMGLLEL